MPQPFIKGSAQMRMARNICVIFIFLEICALQPAIAVTRIDLSERLRSMNTFYEGNLFKRDTGDLPSPSKILGLKKGEDLKSVTSVKTVDGTVKTKMQETYQGLEVIGETVVIGKTKNGKYSNDVSGRLVEGIKKDVPSITPKLSVADAFKIAVKAEGDDAKKVRFNADKDAKLKIYIQDTMKDARGLETSKIDKTAKARLVYALFYRVSKNGTESKPYYIIDANTGEVVDKYQTIENDYCSQLSSASTYKSVGGNFKTGMYKYDGKDRPELKIQRIGDTCIFENYAVRVINFFNVKSYYQMRKHTKAYMFDCKKAFNDTVNGGYSAVSDVLHFATVVYDMYKKWYKTTPLKFKIIARVHYGRNYENAFWDRKQVTFGDGYRVFYPLVSQDVVGHEIGHGIVGQNSGLRYSGQSGGMNEAFADITGEAAEYFSRGKVDWHVGKEITKTRPALRYFIKPSKDGRSLDHASEYCPGQTGVHFSSGVYRVVYYALVHKPGWNIKKAYDVFVLANKLYWRSNSDFGDGGCGCVKAAVDLGYNVQHVREAFMTAGIAPCQTEPLTFGDLKGNKNSPVLFKWEVGPNATLLKVRTTQGLGNVNIYIKKGSPPKSYSYDARSKNLGNEEKIELKNPAAGTYYLLLSSPTSFSGVGMITNLQFKRGSTGGNIIVKNLDSCGIRKRDDMLRVTFTLPSNARKFTIQGSVASGHIHFYLRRGAPVEASKWRGGYDKSLSFYSSRISSRTFCNFKAGVYHVLVGSERRFRGGTITYSYDSHPVKVNN